MSARKDVFNHGIQKRMSFAFILNTEGLRGDEIRIDNSDFVSVTHTTPRQITLMPQCHLRIIGILRRLLVAAKLIRL